MSRWDIVAGLEGLVIAVLVFTLLAASQERDTWHTRYVDIRDADAATDKLLSDTQHDLGDCQDERQEAVTILRQCLIQQEAVK